MEDSLVVPQKVKHRITIWPRNSTPRYVSKKNENICPHRNLYKKVYSSIIHNNQKVETTQVENNKCWHNPQTMLVGI